MKINTKYSKALLAALSTFALVGCQSNSDSNNDGTTVTEWDKVETAQPAEVTVESVSAFFNVSQSDKGIQSADKKRRTVISSFMGSVNLADLNVRGKSIASAPAAYENEEVENGSESGTYTAKYNIDYTTSTMQLLEIYNNYHDIDSTSIDACGNEDETQQNGTWYCDVTFDPNTYEFTSFNCTVNSDFTIDSTMIFKKNSSFIFADNDGDGEMESFRYNIVGEQDGEGFAYIDTNETLWDDSVYEYSLLSKGKIYFNNLSEYLTIDESFDTSNTPHTSGLCNDVAYSGTLYLRGKDDALVELNITAENTMKISIDSDNDGSWDTVETQPLN